VSFVPGSAFFSLNSNAELLASALDLKELASSPPPNISPRLSKWDHTQGNDLRMTQTDCNWFAFDAQSVGEGEALRFSGILAVHRTGTRLTRLGPGFSDAPIPNAPRALQPLVNSGLFAKLPMRPEFDPRPLFISVLYDHKTGRAHTFETAATGELDHESFSFVETDGDHRQLLQGLASEWRPNLPPVLQAFFAHDTPAFAVRAVAPHFELELFLRPRKDPVTYGEDGSPALRGEKTTINYVQRSRLEVIGMVRQRTRDEWHHPIVLRGDATQDRHWMTVSRFNMRWMWLMARLDCGREIMAYEMRTGAGGRKAPADAGDPIGGGAWIVEADGTVRAARNWSFKPVRHEKRPRGLVPDRFRLELPDDGISFVVEHEVPTFVPTRALGEMVEAGVWESPARLVEARGIGGGRFWVDVMPPRGGV
jgi:hypothetical protein